MKSMWITKVVWVRPVFNIYILRFLILRLFPTTLTLEKAMAPAAMIGLSNPRAASGKAAML